MKQTRRIYTYNYLLMAAGVAHERAEASAKASKDSFTDCLNTVLHCALALEAFMNHLGAQAMPLWGPLKKKLSPKENLEILAAHNRIAIDWDKAPYQSFASAMTFRNLIVHAETEDVEGPCTAPSDKPIPKWQTYCTRQRSTRILLDTRKLIQEFPAKLGLDSTPFFLLAERTK